MLILWNSLICSPTGHKNLAVLVGSFDVTFVQIWRKKNHVKDTKNKIKFPFTLFMPDREELRA